MQLTIIVIMEHQKVNQNLKTEIDIIEVKKDDQDLYENNENDTEEDDYGSNNKNSEDIEDLKHLDEIEVEAKYVAKKVKELIKESVLIFILPPSIEELEERLKVRNLDSEEMIQNRLKIAEEEIKEAGFYDYVLVNKDVKGAVNKLKMIIDEENEKD